MYWKDAPAPRATDSNGRSGPAGPSVASRTTPPAQVRFLLSISLHPHKSEFFPWFRWFSSL